MQLYCQNEQFICFGTAKVYMLTCPQCRRCPVADPGGLGVRALRQISGSATDADADADNNNNNSR